MDPTQQEKLVSINQVRSRFADNKDVEFEIACERKWGEVEVMLSIFRAVQEDGTVSKPTGSIQFDDDEDAVMWNQVNAKPRKTYSKPFEEYTDPADLDRLCLMWHISPDEEVWEIVIEGEEE